MRGKSHIHLGKYIIDHYMENTGLLHRKLFLFGCIQPDRNPFTYLKGSLRHRLLQGHDYHNAMRFMQRISGRLEKRRPLNPLDCYTFGKLIHYIADAFTYVHNDAFSGSLSCHRNYERKLQNFFLTYLNQTPKPDISSSLSIMETIEQYHRDYCTRSQSILTDSVFALETSCCVAALLYSPTKIRE
ncbi:MAG: zinc dependent phospholipase C family protein [Firmicutes bacterium]|nr:zinc dependent phospholipase C family protein [Bacillota bacterium]